ncbi:MAG: NAD(P)-dependent oxidoreductase [Agriterribacter sp.]
MNKIAVLGLGRMGTGIALSILRSGRTVTVWNRNRQKADELIHAGATWANTPAVAAADADAVISMVADDTSSREVWLGKDGAMPAMQKDSFIIECSTISVHHAKLLAASAQEYRLTYIDCPVTGIPDAARKGQISLLVGASNNDLEKCSALLQSFSKKIRHFGPVGAGTAYKLMINLMGAVQIAALAEGIAMAEKCGLDKESVISAIEDSAAASPQVVRYARRMAEKTFLETPAFTTDLRYKDALYAVELAKDMHCPAKLGETAMQWFGEAKKEYNGKDEAYVVTLMTT